MGTNLPAEDFECDDESGLDGSGAPTVPRRIRKQAVLGPDGQPREEMRVACPFREEWPTFDDCLHCEHWRGYVLDPRDQDSFVTCTRIDQRPGLAPYRATRAAATPVSAIMSDPFSIRPELSMQEIASLFVDRKISGVPVVDEAGKAIGVVSKTDLIEAQASGLATDQGPSRLPLVTRDHEKLGKGFHAQNVSALTAKELMTPVVHSLPESASVAEAVALMAKQRVHRLPIVTGSGRVVGMVTTLDITRWVKAGEGPLPATGL